MAATLSSPTDGSSSLSSVNPSFAQYSRSLVEEYAKSELPPDRTSQILFAFLDHLLPDGLENIVEDIKNAPDLRVLADHYVSAILIPIRASGGKTPSALATPRFVNDVDDIAAEITSQKRNQAQLKARCLARDNNCCVLTRAYDSNMADKLSDKEREGITTSETQAAHIIPFSLAEFSERDRHAKAIAWEAIYHAFPSIRCFSANDINDPRNALTLSTMLHSAFGSFSFCLEPIGTPNYYYIRRYRKFPTIYNSFLPEGGFVTFKAYDDRYPLPDENLLTVHALVGAIFHASGMAETIERILQDRDEIPGLATDGSTPVGTLLIAF